MRYRIIYSSFLFIAFAAGIFFGLHRDVPHSFSELNRENLEETNAFESMRWFNAQRAYPSGHIPEDWRQKALDHIRQENFQKSSATASVSWTSLGPTNVGGRARSIAIDPTNSNIIYSGSVSGGVWKTTNAGTTWFPTSDFTSNLVIGCLAIDPANSSNIYAGTGEGYFNVDALRGAGILKSTDGGATWSSASAQSDFNSNPAGYSYYYVNKLIVRPDNSNTLYAALDGGIWRTTNKGTNWSRLSVPSAGSSTFCVDLIENQGSPDILYAAFGLFGNSGIYKTTNGGTSWSKMGGGLPTSGFARTSLALAPSNPSIIYAVLDDSVTHDTHSIEISTNGGTTWSAVSNPSDIPNSTSHLGKQGWYNNAIAVHPTDPNTVIVGGVNLFKTTNGGTSWAQVSNGAGSSPPNAHVDQHALVFDPANTNNLYVGNDGGMFKSTNAGVTFSPINTSLVTVQFYSAGIHPTLTVYYGGTQDNGTLKSIGTSSWTSVFSGDGGVTTVDFTTPTIVYTEYVYLAVYKSSNSGSTWTRVTTGIPPPPAASPNYGTSDRCSFIAPYAMDPSNSQVLVAGTFKVYRSTNGGSSWSAISADLTGDGDGTNQVGSLNSSITTIAIAKTSSATIYVGTSGGVSVAKVQVTTNTGGTWTDRTGTLPDRTVKSFAIDPGNAAHAFVVLSGYGSGHVYATTNTGATWTNASGNLPDIPVNAIVIDPVNLSHLFIGTDLGIFETVNGGTNWNQQNFGLANVSVADLDLRSDGMLFAATHGRGMFESTAPVAVQEVRSDIPSKYELNQNYPNPFNPSTTIPFSITKESFVRLKVFDLLGQLVGTLVDQKLLPGSYSAAFNGEGQASGVYVYTLETDDLILTKKMLLLR